MFTIKFVLDDGRVVSEEATAGEPILSVARRANVPIDAPCAGNGTCGKCKVRIESGEVLGERDKHISKKDFADGYRLACQCETKGAATLLVPQSAHAWQNRIRVADFSSARAQESFMAMKEALSGEKYRADDAFIGLTVDMEPPSESDATADRERLVRAIAKTLGTDSEHISIALHTLRKLPEVLRENDYSAGVLIHKEGGPGGVAYHIIDIAGGEAPIQVGVCIDIGTTTISAAIVDLNTRDFLATGSVGNAQIRYGGDVINRLVESARPGGVARLRDAVTKESIRPLVAKLCEAAGIGPRQIVRASIAGNTTMMHLFLGIYGNNIRLEPYVPAFFGVDRIRGSEADIGIHPDADVLLAPSVGSYVGGDITAGTFAAGIAGNEGFSLFLDLGTNGELVFGNSDFLMTCACSAGPAFEGGEIACGMRATDGAITEVVIDKDTMEPSYKVIGDEGQLPVGLCGSGLIDLISGLFEAGTINAKGKFIAEGERISVDEWGISRYRVVAADKTLTGNDIYVSDADIDNFIRAKGAIFSAIVTMLKSLDMDMDMIEDVYLAGGIGSGIDIGNAINIGMLPKLPLERFHYIGNTSLSGAYAMLVSDKARERIEGLADGMTYLELSAVPGYMDEFVAACFLPHTDAGLFA
ncbi:MAG: corrinoid activation/regeneration protein AcsV [Clostridiales bacterium]|nr:corrinoid activation/regeneration protein AcsV [Clostridiales bacterium]